MNIKITLYRVVDCHGAKISDWTPYYNNAVELAYSANIQEQPCAVESIKIAGEFEIQTVHVVNQNE